MPINPALFSSVTDQWATPQWLFDALNEQYHFSVDVCALPHNAKCQKYYTPDDNGLNQEWRGICWMNPPYGNPEFPCKPSCSKKICKDRGYHIGAYRPGIIDWMEKAYNSSKNGATVVCLVPSRTDTEWWHRFAMHGEIFFLPGRLKFGHNKGSAPFPSAIIVFEPHRRTRSINYGSNSWRRGNFPILRRK